MRMGGCCDCQETVPVRRATYPELQRLADHLSGGDVDSMLEEFGETFEYVCEDHNAFGSPCSGSGQTPQGITKELS
jgi:hypothetical protein